MSAQIEVKGLSYAYSGDHEVLKNISFSLEAGEILSVIGPNGAGKSTLLNCICGVIRPTSGKVFAGGIDMSDAKVEVAAKHVGYMRQSVDIVYDYSVEDVVVMGRAAYVGTLALPSAEDRRIAHEAIREMELGLLADRPYTQLSGGEKQKVLIARLIAQRPQVIIMDEPTSALDYGNQKKTLDMIKKLSADGFVIIMTTHNPDHALQLGGKVALIGRDRSFSFGDSEDVLDGKTLSRLYGVEIKTQYVEAFGRKVCVCM